MGILKSFKNGVLSSPRQRQRYFYFKNLTAGFCGIGAYTYVHFTLGMSIAVGSAVGVGAAILVFLTVAPVIALLVCLIEQMA